MPAYLYSMRFSPTPPEPGRWLAICGDNYPYPMYTRLDASVELRQCYFSGDPPAPPPPAPTTPKPAFWMVYGEGRGTPTYKHASLRAAEKEAERLAGLCPGTKFHILAPVNCVQAAVDLHWSEVPEKDTEVPF